MKKIILIVACIATIFLAINIRLNIENQNAETKPIIETEAGTEFKTEQTLDDDIVEVPVSDVEAITSKENGLTMQDAEELCGEVLGDKAEENDFPISYRCIGAVSVHDTLYYVMHITWLVNGDHWSYIGNCFVSSDGQEIYDGIVSPEEYKMTELRWSK